MSYKKLASDVLEGVGGKENIESVVHCATRLRFKLIDDSKAKTTQLNQHPEIIKVIQSAGQYQVVIGSHVIDIFSELISLANFESSSNPIDNTEKSGIINKAIDIISSIFTPILGIIAGAGVLKGLMNLSVFLGWMSTDSGTYQLLYTAANGIFYFMPMALAITAARKFKTNEFLALALAMSLLSVEYLSYAATMEESGGALTFLSLPVIYSSSIGGYSSTVIPIIVAVWIQSYVEKFLKKIVPNFLRIFGVTLLTLVLMVPLTYLAIGPLGLVFGQIVGNGYQIIYNMSSITAGAILGGFWQVLVIFGMHWGLVPISLNNLATTGMDTMLPISLAGVLSQSGAAFGVFLKTKDMKLRTLASSGSLTALFGITEPTVYGVTLPLKKPFIFGCIGGAIGGAITASQHVISYGFGQSILTFPNFISPDKDTSKVIVSMIACLIGFLFAAIMTYFFGGVNNKKEENDIKIAKDTLKQVNTEIENLNSPLNGEVINLKDVEDEAFSSGAMGEGIAIIPSDGKLFAPVDGEIAFLFPTCHALGIRTRTGTEILIHIGMDTVELAGNGFIAHITEGEQIKEGQLLIEFDIDFIKSKNKSTITPIVITNSSRYNKISVINPRKITAGKQILSIKK